MDESFEGCFGCTHGTTHGLDGQFSALFPVHLTVRRLSEGVRRLTNERACPVGGRERAAALGSVSGPAPLRRAK